MNGKILGLIIAGLVLLGGWYMVRESSKPLLGEQLPDLGQEHVNDISGVEYNSNPPTSGIHFPVWAKKGAYDRILSDGYLIHSLEHGYVVVSYNCDVKLVSSFRFPPRSDALVSKAYAHLGEEEASASTEATDSASSQQATSSAKLHRMYKTTPFTPENPPEVEVELPESFKSEDCTKLVDQLKTLTKVADRVIIVPRPGMDAQVALTAWRRLYKMHLSSSAYKMQTLELENAKQFIKDFHNRGPEKTME